MEIARVSTIDYLYSKKMSMIVSGEQPLMKDPLVFDPKTRQIRGRYQFIVAIEGVIPSKLIFASMELFVNQKLPEIPLESFSYIKPPKSDGSYPDMSIMKNIILPNGEISKRDSYIPVAVIDDNVVQSSVRVLHPNAVTHIILPPNHLNLDNGNVLIAVNEKDIKDVTMTTGILSKTRVFPGLCLYRNAWQENTQGFVIIGQAKRMLSKQKSSV